LVPTPLEYTLPGRVRCLKPPFCRTSVQWVADFRARIAS